MSKYIVFMLVLGFCHILGASELSSLDKLNMRFNLDSEICKALRADCLPSPDVVAEIEASANKLMNIESERKEGFLYLTSFYKAMALKDLDNGDMWVSKATSLIGAEKQRAPDGSWKEAADMLISTQAVLDGLKKSKEIDEQLRQNELVEKMEMAYEQSKEYKYSRLTGDELSAKINEYRTSLNNGEDGVCRIGLANLLLLKAQADQELQVESLAEVEALLEKSLQVDNDPRVFAAMSRYYLMREEFLRAFGAAKQAAMLITEKTGYRQREVKWVISELVAKVNYSVIMEGPNANWEKRVLVDYIPDVFNKLSADEQKQLNEHFDTVRVARRLLETGTGLRQSGEGGRPD